MKMKHLFTCIALLFCGLFMGAAPASEGYKVGDKARDFRLKNVDGKMVSMRDNKNARGYIVTFTCNECPYSKLYESRLIALHNKYAPKGFPVIAINPNDAKVSPGDSFEMMQQLAKEKKYPFPYLHDETQEIARAYGATRTPHLYIVKRTQGDNFEVAYIGTIDDNPRDAGAAKQKYAEAALDQLITGKPVNQTVTKAVGCTIKWKEA